MGIDRRTMLKSAAVAGATALVRASPLPARERRTAPSNAVGMLYDATLCIGCKACMVACKEANGDPADTRTPGMKNYDAPTDLNDRTRTIIKQFADGDQRSFVKMQCMHCIDPACAAACMLGALEKRDFGVVTWDPDLCIGCRYCQVACPFNVPKFEWESATPSIVKCEMCSDRLAEGNEPACCEACPRGAAIFGERADLLRIAHGRIRQHPDRYYPKVYGETELGGTQVLVLSAVPFEKIGLLHEDEEPVPHLQQTIQHGIYKGFVAPAALYAVLGGVMLRHRRVSQINGSGDSPASVEEATDKEAIR